MSVDGGADQRTRVVDWLRELPYGAAVTWADDGLSRDHPFIHAWGDIRVPGSEQALGLTWVWDLIEPADSTDSDLALRVVPDLRRVAVEGPDGVEAVVVLHVGDGSVLHGDVETFQAATLRPGREVQERCAWSVARVDAALAAWATRHAGRDDLHFQCGVGATSAALDRAIQQRPDADDAGSPGSTG